MTIEGNFGQPETGGESDIPEWLRGSNASEEIKDFFRMQKAFADRYKEALQGKVDAYLNGIERATTPTERRKIILTAMVVEQFERDISYLMIRPDPRLTPQEVMGQIEDLERKINALNQGIGIEPKHPERDSELPQE